VPGRAIPDLGPSGVGQLRGSQLSARQWDHDFPDRAGVQSRKQPSLTFSCVPLQVRDG
jgi:hypothetical protein